MDPQVQIITVATPDLDVARSFYVEGLGWPVTLDVPGEVLFLQVGPGLLLTFFDARAAAADVGDGSPATAPGAGVSLAQVVPTAEAVTEAFDRAVAAGASPLKPPQLAAFGGTHAYIEDPLGLRWEIAHNPGLTIEADGRVRLEEITG